VIERHAHFKRANRRGSGLSRNQQSLRPLTGRRLAHALTGRVGWESTELHVYCCEILVLRSAASPIKPLPGGELPLMADISPVMSASILVGSSLAVSDVERVYRDLSNSWTVGLFPSAILASSGQLRYTQTPI
jgi:hypothetical protein